MHVITFHEYVYYNSRSSKLERTEPSLWNPRMQLNHLQGLAILPAVTCSVTLRIIISDG
jgi:hypothetical protein